MQLNLSTIRWKDSRVVVRAVLAVLVAANLVMAVIAFKPFGGGADDLRREQLSLQQQLTALQSQLTKSKLLVQKVQTARTASEQFLAEYVTDRHVMTSTVQGELVNIADSSGVVFQPTSFGIEPVDGSDTLSQMTINAGCQGTYQALAKFLNLIDKSPRFLIIESLNVSQVQSGDKLNVTVKVDTFVRQQAGDQAAPAPASSPAEEGAGGGL